MPRIARIIAPGIPHHVTQRGNMRMETFFCDEDYQAYMSLIAEWCGKFGVSVWCYCLMPNHTHIIAVPETEEGLRRAIVSTPEATAIDLVGHLGHAGGLDQVATVIAELAEDIDATLLVKAAETAPLPWAQRLGYLLELSCYVVLNPVSARQSAL